MRSLTLLAGLLCAGCSFSQSLPYEVVEYTLSDEERRALFDDLVAVDGYQIAPWVLEQYCYQWVRHPITDASSALNCSVVNSTEDKERFVFTTEYPGPGQGAAGIWVAALLDGPNALILGGATFADQQDDYFDVHDAQVSPSGEHALISYIAQFDGYLSIVSTSDGYQEGFESDTTLQGKIQDLCAPEEFSPAFRKLVADREDENAIRAVDGRPLLGLPVFSIENDYAYDVRAKFVDDDRVLAKIVDVVTEVEIVDLVGEAGAQFFGSFKQYRTQQESFFVELRRARIWDGVGDGPNPDDRYTWRLVDCVTEDEFNSAPRAADPISSRPLALRNGEIVVGATDEAVRDVLTGETIGDDQFGAVYLVDGAFPAPQE